MHTVALFLVSAIEELVKPTELVARSWTSGRFLEVALQSRSDLLHLAIPLQLPARQVQYAFLLIMNYVKLHRCSNYNVIDIQRINIVVSYGQNCLPAK